MEEFQPFTVWFRAHNKTKLLGFRNDTKFITKEDNSKRNEAKRNQFCVETKRNEISKYFRFEHPYCFLDKIAKCIKLKKGSVFFKGC